MRNLRREILIGSVCACTGQLSWGAAGIDDITGGVGLNQSKDVPIDRFSQANAATEAQFGCSWSPAASATPDAGRGPQLLLSSGNTQLDAGFERERRLLCQLMRASPSMYFFDEGSDDSANAFATPDHLSGSAASDGTVVFGLRLIRREQNRLGSISSFGMKRWDHVCAAILAHETGHITQFQRREEIQRFPRGKYMELHADLLAGWYMRRRADQIYVDLASSIQEFFSIGDYQFNSPSHHGTPQERWHFFQTGAQIAQTAATFETAFRQGLVLVSRS